MTNVLQPIRHSNVTTQFRRRAEAHYLIWQDMSQNRDVHTTTFLPALAYNIQERREPFLLIAFDTKLVESCSVLPDVLSQLSNAHNTEIQFERPPTLRDGRPITCDLSSRRK